MKDESTGARDPAERKTLEDALNIATAIIDEEGVDAGRTNVQSDRYTLAAGFLVLCNDMAAMLDASKKATHYCGWCEQANGNSRTGLQTYSLEEVREHTVGCENNPLVQRLNETAKALDEACDLAEEANGDPSSCSYIVPIGERVAELRQVNARAKESK